MSLIHSFNKSLLRTHYVLVSFMFCFPSQTKNGKISALWRPQSMWRLEIVSTAYSGSLTLQSQTWHSKGRNSTVGVECNSSRPCSGSLLEGSWLIGATHSGPQNPDCSTWFRHFCFPIWKGLVSFATITLYLRCIHMPQVFGVGPSSFSCSYFPCNSMTIHDFSCSPLCWPDSQVVSRPGPCPKHRTRYSLASCKSPQRWWMGVSFHIHTCRC